MIQRCLNAVMWLMAGLLPIFCLSIVTLLVAVLFASITVVVVAGWVLMVSLYGIVACTLAVVILERLGGSVEAWQEKYR